MKLATILRETRAWAEEVQAQFPFDYGDDLCGLCAVASKELFTRLKANGFKDVLIACNDCHCFVIYKGRVLDVTATQFRKPAIYISRNISGYWNAETIFDNIEDINNFQQEVGWHDTQIWAGGRA